MIAAAGEARESAGVAAVDRALVILGSIADHAEPSTLARLAAATGLYKSTILRLLGSLETAGYVVRLGDGRYTLGAAAHRLGAGYERLNPLRHQVLPVLEELVAAGSESASFHVRHGEEARLCLFRVDSRHATLDRVAAGDILPLDRGAAGRVLLAFAGEPGSPFDTVRSEGFAHSAGERDPSCAGLAAAVFGPQAALLGALSLSGPAERFAPAMIAAWRPRLIAAAARLSVSLGHMPQSVQR